MLTLKLALTVVAPVIVTAHVPTPEQPPPDQPVKFEPLPAEADSVMLLPWVRLSLQSAPHEIPAGDEVTVPVPDPVLVTVNVYTLTLNVAVTLLEAFMVTTQVPMPVQSPDQPPNVELPAAAAVSVTDEP